MIYVDVHKKAPFPHRTQRLLYFILTQLHISVDSDYHPDANTKSQSKVKYNARIFTLVDHTNLQ